MALDIAVESKDGKDVHIKKRRLAMKTRILLALITLLAAVFWLSQNCLAADPEIEIDLDVTPKAQIIQLIMVKGNWNGKPAVMVKAKIKNISEQAIQFKATCDFVDTNTSSGFMVPKVGNPAMKPGGAGTATFPFPSGEIPKKLKIRIEDFTLDD